MSFVTPGRSYEFCLDPDGSIAAVKAESAASSMVGFLIKAKREQGITNVLQLKLFTSGGEHVVYRCSDSLKLGGLKGAAAAEYLEKNAVGGLISYKLDSRGEVKEADLPYAGIPAPHQRPESLRLEHKATRELLYRNAQSAFEGIINMDGETVVFLIPDDLEDENGYDITSASYFMNNTRYAPDAYCMGIEDGRADFLVYTPKDKYTDQEGAVLVSKITRMVNQEGETTECLHGYKDSGEVTVLAKEDGMFTQAGVKEGDVIRYLTGKQGYATGVRKILDYASGRIVNDANLSYSNGFRVIKGNVYHKYGDLIGITSGAVTSEEVKQNLENQVVTGAKIYLFDPEKQNKISAVTADSICDYLHMPEEYSTVLVYTRNSACKMVVIYR